MMTSPRGGRWMLRFLRPVQRGRPAPGRPRTAGVKGHVREPTNGVKGPPHTTQPTHYTLHTLHTPHTSVCSV